MKLSMYFDEADRALLSMELRQFFRHPRCMHFIPLIAFGAFFTAWLYPVASPLAAVMVVVFCGLELQFNNIFFRTSNEMEALMLLPVPWGRIIFIKNLATIILSLLFVLITSMTLLYFSPSVVESKQLIDAGLYFLTVIFPLLHIGNGRSMEFPRRCSGLRIDDLIEALWMAATLGFISIPFLLFMNLFHLPILCLIYGSGWWVLWYRFSIPQSVREIEHKSLTLCEVP
jgi:hypothetical protein